MKRTEKNSNNSYTTYHDNGKKSFTYKNMLDDGYTTYHDNGKKSFTYKNMSNDGYTTYSSNGGSDVGGGIAAAIAFLFCIICTFSIFKYTSILPLIVIALAIPLYFVMKKILDVKVAKKWSEIVAGFGFRLFSAAVFKYAGNLDFGEYIGAILGLFIIILILFYFYILNSDSFGNTYIFCSILIFGFFAGTSKYSNILFAFFMMVGIVCAIISTIKSIKNMNNNV